MGEAVSYPQVRSGTYAVIGGVARPGLYPANSDHVVLKSTDADNPEPTLFAWNDTHGVWSAKVPVEQCERIFSARWYGMWRGHRVAIDALAADASVASVTYADSSGAWAAENGFTHVDKYEYQREVPAAELVDVHEVQTDLLFEQWRTRFPAPDGVATTGWRS